jgi:8-oxo-dGTP pyrophosphatase MutT (NUDIX family)
MGKIIFEITDSPRQKFSTVEKSDDLQGAKMARRMSRLVARRPDLVENNPKLAQYKDKEAEMQQRADQTRERHREEKPGVVHEDLDQDDGSEDLERSYHIDAGPLDQGPNFSGVRKGSDGHVASVAVTHESHILMGKRRDNQKWTLPGGHLDEGEDPHEGGKRELKEEAGIDAKKLKHLGSEKLKTFTGKEKTIHAFQLEVKERPKTSMVLDPDQEVDRWQWIKHKNGKLPDHVKANLHSPKNIVLDQMGLNKGGVLSVPQMREQGKKEGKENVGGGLVDRDLFYAFRKKGPTDKKTEKPAELENKSMFFVRDLLKSGSHKYIRKYQHNGEWIYIYHEGDQHHKLSEDDLAAHHHLAEHGDDAERAHHSELISRIQHMTDEDVEGHKLLAEHGEEHERAHHKSILKILGHKKEEKDKLGKLEQTVTQADRQDEADKELTPAQRHKASETIGKVINEQITYLHGHATTPISQALVPLMNKNDFTKPSGDAKSIRGILDGLHKMASKLEAKQGSLTSSNSTVTQHGGTYGNVIYNKAIAALVDAGIVPKAYADEHKREARATEHKAQGMKGIQERAEARAREQAERERRELGELNGSMAFHMASMMEGGGNRVEKAKELDRSIKRIFGKSLTKEQFPYNFESNGLKTKIVSAEAHGDTIHLKLQVYDADGEPIMESWERKWSLKDGRPNIYNSYMAVKTNKRNGAKIGDLINKSQRELMKSLPNGGTVNVTAALDVGGYNWANQGFSFETESELRGMRDNFQRFAQEKGVHLTDADMRNFTEPVHIAAFTDGKKYEKNVRSYKLTPDQISSSSLSGAAGSHALTADEKRSGTSTRMLCHLGKAFMLGRSWHGEWDSKEVTSASRHADEYRQLRERAIKVLEPTYLNVVSETKAGNRSRGAPDTRQVTSRSSLPSGTNANSEHRIRTWTPRGGGNIRLTKTRIDRVMRMDETAIRHFIANAPLTSRARGELRKRLSERGRNGQS